MLNKIKKSISYLNKRVNNTDSLLYVYLLSKIYKINNILYITSVEFSNNEEDVIYAYIPYDNKYINGKGIYTKEEIMKQHDIPNNTFKEFTFKSDNTILKKSFKLNIRKEILENIIETLMFIYKH